MGAYGRLRVLSGSREGTDWDLDAEGAFVLGSAAGTRFRVDDGGVAPEHATLRCAGDGVTLEPRDGVPPPTIGGSAVTSPRRLAPGDRLEVGPVSLVFEGPTSRGPAAPPSPPARGSPFPVLRYSGAAPPGGIAAGLGAGIAAGYPLAVLYAIVAFHSPCIGAISIAAAGGFGYLTGMATAAGLRAGRVRGAGAHRIVACLVGVAALHMAWVAYVATALGARQGPGASMGHLYTRPGLLTEFMGVINENGLWGIGKSPPVNGTLLTVFWVAEALFIVGMCLYGTSSSMPALFCERCRTWGRTVEGALRVSCDRRAIDAGLAAGDLSFLRDAEPAHETAADAFRVDLSACTGCGETRTLSLRHVTRRVENGKVKEDVNDVAVDLSVSVAEAEWIGALAEARPAALPPGQRFRWKGEETGKP